MERFAVNIAGLTIEIACLYSYTKALCRDYIVSEQTPCFSVSVTEAEIAAEISAAETPVGEAYAESVCVYRKIAELLPRFHRFVMHGAAITYQQDAYVFTAPSGTGKSTHIKLWYKYLKSDVGIVNGDKPVVTVDGGVTVCGTPWAGKEGWQSNRTAPVRAICILKQAKTNTITKVKAEAHLTMLLNQVYLPKDGEALASTLRMLNTLFQKVPVYILECDISEDAVKTAFTALTGKAYPQEGK